MASMSSSANASLDLKDAAVNRRVTCVKQILVNMVENAEHILTLTPVSVLKDSQERTVTSILMIAKWHPARMVAPALTSSMTLCVYVSLRTLERPVRVKWTPVNQANVQMEPPAHLQLTTVTTFVLALLASLVATVRMTSMSAPTAHAEMGPPALTLMAAMSASAAKVMKAVTA